MHEFNLVEIPIAPELESLTNPIEAILKMDDNTFVTLLSWMRNGIPMGISQATKDHTYIYLKKETLTPFINIIDILLKTNLDEVVALFDKMEIGVDLTIQK